MGDFHENFNGNTINEFTSDIKEYCPVSCYIVMTLTRHVILAADSRRRIFGEQGRARFERPILLDDARKLRRIGNYVWTTGVGLSSFHEKMQAGLKCIFRGFKGNQKLPLQELLTIEKQEALILESYRTTQNEALELMKSIGGSPVDPEEIFTDLVIAALSDNDIPVVARYRADESFKPKVFTGPGEILLPPPAGDESSYLGGEIMPVLRGTLELLAQTDPGNISNKAFEFLPPLMARIAKSLPDHVSASGDLVVIGPGETNWMVF